MPFRVKPLCRCGHVESHHRSRGQQCDWGSGSDTIKRTAPACECLGYDPVAPPEGDVSVTLTSPPVFEERLSPASIRFENGLILGMFIKGTGDAETAMKALRGLVASHESLEHEVRALRREVADLRDPPTDGP